MRTEKKWKWICSVTTLALTLVLVDVRADGQGGGGGGDLPDPMAMSNQYYELKVGELYLLSGKIIFAPAIKGNSRKLYPYLLVDLDAHPGLGSRNSKEAPMYPIMDNPASWRSFDGMSVKLAGLADSRIVYTGRESEPQQLLMLYPMPELSILPQKH